MPVKGQCPAQQILKKVVVPINSRSSIGSCLSSVRDQSSEVDTPATSIAVTPAESSVKDEIFSRLRAKSSDTPFTRGLQLSGRGKRKHAEVDELLEADALLAQTLQEHEYEEVEHQHQQSKPETRKPWNWVEDSEDDPLLAPSSRANSPEHDHFPLSTKICTIRGKILPSSAAPDDAIVDGKQKGFRSSYDVTDIDMPGKKKVKAIQRTYLPNRAARDSANKSMKDKASRLVIDSEDSEFSDGFSDTSLFASDSDSGNSEESDAEDHDVAIAVNVPVNISSAPTAVSSTSRRRRAAAAQGGNPIHVRRSWQRRIEDRVSATCPPYLNRSLTSCRLLESDRS